MAENQVTQVLETEGATTSNPVRQEQTDTGSEPIVLLSTGDTGPSASGSWRTGTHEDASPYWREAARRSRWRAYVAERFRQLAERIGEPGYPSLEALNRALHSVDFLLPPTTPTPSVLPSEEGGVELIWQRNGWDVQVELDEAGRDFVWTRERTSGEVTAGDLEELREILREILDQLGGE